jgi:hypothetical protein
VALDINIKLFPTELRLDIIVAVVCVLGHLNFNHGHLIKMNGGLP